MHRSKISDCLISFSISQLQGGIACGKTSVCDVFQKYDVPVINADLIARQSKFQSVD